MLVEKIAHDLSTNGWFVLDNIQDDLKNQELDEFMLLYMDLINNDEIQTRHMESHKLLRFVGFMMETSLLYMNINLVRKLFLQYYVYHIIDLTLILKKNKKHAETFLHCLYDIRNDPIMIFMKNTFDIFTPSWDAFFEDKGAKFTADVIWHKDNFYNEQ